MVPISQQEQARYRVQQAMNEDLPEQDRQFFERTLATIDQALPASGMWHVPVGMASETAIQAVTAALRQASVIGIVQNYRDGTCLDMEF